jgi:hypothetical protein
MTQPVLAADTTPESPLRHGAVSATGGWFTAAAMPEPTSMRRPQRNTVMRGSAAHTRTGAR